MSETKDLLQRGGEGFAPREGIIDSLIRRRDRKRRNQRIAAGVVGIAVFVAAVWTVRDVASLDRAEKAVVPAISGATGPAETAPVSGELDVVRRKRCSGDARSRLELTKVGHRPPDQVVIRVRYEVFGSPVGNEWHIAIRPVAKGNPAPIFRGNRVASDVGHWAVQVRVLTDGRLPIRFVRFRATASDTQTGQVCTVEAGF